MEGQRVQEYTVETGPNGMPIARLGQVHNLITFVKAGNEKVHYLDGRWVDDGQHPVDPDTVPQEYKDAVAAIPFTPDRQNAGVLLTCEFCDHPVDSREYAKHLIHEHMKGVSKPTDPETGAGQTVDPSGDAPRRFRPEDLPPDNYVIDDKGFVVLNKDGSPRKKAGRPAATSQE